MFKIIFKVKEQSKENLTITVSEVAASNGKDEVKLNSVKTNISLKKADSKPDNPNNNTSTDNTNTTNNNTTNNNNTVNNDKNNTTNNNNNTNKNTANTSNNATNNTNKNNTNSKNNAIVANTNSPDNIKDGIFPKTGAGKIAFSLIGLLVLVAVIFYARIRMIDKKAKKNNIIK